MPPRNWELHWPHEQCSAAEGHLSPGPHPSSCDVVGWQGRWGWDQRPGGVCMRGVEKGVG